jgi:hypothetical protein
MSGIVTPLLLYEPGGVHEVIEHNGHKGKHHNPVAVDDDGVDLEQGQGDGGHCCMWTGYLADVIGGVDSTRTEGVGSGGEP